MRKMQNTKKSKKEINYWLAKSEPSVYSIDDLQKQRKTHWEGVRNYQARNFMRDSMRVGDLVLFYHSNAKPSGVVGIAMVCSKPYPDHFAQDKKSKYYDAKATKESPIWHMVDVCFVKKFEDIISLEDLKNNKKLKNMMVVQKGSRLSVQPVSEKDFEEVLRMQV